MSVLRVEDTCALGPVGRDDGVGCTKADVCGVCILSCWPRGRCRVHVDKFVWFI